MLKERLPYNVGRAADDAEYGELDDWRNVKRKRGLHAREVSVGLCAVLTTTYTILVGGYGLRKHVGSHAKHGALQRLRYHCRRHDVGLESTAAS